MTIKIIRKGNRIIHKVVAGSGLVIEQRFIDRETAVSLLQECGWNGRCDLGGDAATYQFIKVVA